MKRKYRVSFQKKEPFTSYCVYSLFLVGSVLLIFLVFYVVHFALTVLTSVLFPMLLVSMHCSYLIALRFYLTFIETVTVNNSNNINKTNKYLLNTKKTSLCICLWKSRFLIGTDTEMWPGYTRSKWDPNPLFGNWMSNRKNVLRER